MLLFFPCSECGRREGPTTRGKCRECYPEGWSTREGWGAIFEAYRAQTGKEPLDDWPAFGRWSKASLVVSDDPMASAPILK